mmetsp:Transcript_18879/g.38308  ORF Transcript_18879/g.38308 Transcript_18879/m.38308 type:complete len:245 (-) Transcript_18879:889-1623(-)
MVIIIELPKKFFLMVKRTSAQACSTKVKSPPSALLLSTTSSTTTSLKLPPIPDPLLHTRHLSPFLIMLHLFLFLFLLLIFLSSLPLLEFSLSIFHISSRLFDFRKYFHGRLLLILLQRLPFGIGQFGRVNILGSGCTTKFLFEISFSLLHPLIDQGADMPLFVFVVHTGHGPSDLFEGGFGSDGIVGTFVRMDQEAQGAISGDDNGFVVDGVGYVQYVEGVEIFPFVVRLEEAVDLMSGCAEIG